MITTKNTKASKVTYLGVPARVWEVRTAGPHSDRVRVTQWLADSVGQNTTHPAGTVVLTRMTGNLLKGGGSLGTEIVAPDAYANDEDINALAAQLLAN